MKRLCCRVSLEIPLSLTLQSFGSVLRFSLQSCREEKKVFPVLLFFLSVSPPFSLSLFFFPPQAFPLPGLVSVQLERVRGRMWRDVRSASGRDVYRSRRSYCGLTSTELACMCVCVFRTELWNNFKNKLSQLPKPNHSCSVQIDKIIDVIYVLCVHTFECTHTHTQTGC